MAAGDTTDLAAMVSMMRTQQDTLTELLSAVDESLCSLTKAMESGSIKAELSAIESVFADVAVSLESNSVAKAIKAAVAAISAMNPSVNVTVSPTPITVKSAAPVIHVMPAPDPKGATWEVRIPGIGYGAADRVMKITRTN